MTDRHFRTGRRRGPGRIIDRVALWSEWSRSWLITAAVLCWVLSLIAIWVVYAGTHLVDRYQQADPGAAVIDDQRRFQVHSIRQTEVILDGEDRVPSSANTVFVVVDIEMTLLREREILGCNLPLVAVGKRTWTSETFYSRELPSWCNTDDVTVGEPFPYQLIFQVPVKYADQVYGVAIEDFTSAAPMTVLRPPTG